jgi:hypothetical protein
MTPQSTPTAYPKKPTQFERVTDRAIVRELSRDQERSLGWREELRANLDYFSLGTDGLR